MAKKDDTQKKSLDLKAVTDRLKSKIVRRGFQIRDHAVGTTILGIFEGKRSKDLEELDGETGEYVKKTKSLVVFENPATEAKDAYWENAGLRTALEASDVVPGDMVLITRLEKTEVRSGKNKGRQVNQYDVQIFGGTREEFRELIAGGNESSQ